MIRLTSPAAIGSVVPIRNSPAEGSASASSSPTLVLAVVEQRDAASRQRACVDSGFNALGGPLEQRHSQKTFQFGNGL